MKLILRLPLFFSKFALLISSIALILAPLIYIIWLIFDTGIMTRSSQYFIFSEKGPSFTSKRPKNWVSVKQLTSRVIWPIIVSEDWSFYQHAGIDWNQLGIVLKEASKTLELKRGASTISQQVVKNLFLSNERSLLRKFNEMLLTFYLEQKLSKAQILERYLNLAEFDHHLYGIGKAAWHYFGKSPSQLSWREGAFLAMLLPSPKRYSASFHRKKLTPFVQRQLHHILNKVRMAGFLTEEELFNQLNTPFSWEQVPDVAPSWSGMEFDPDEEVIEGVEEVEQEQHHAEQQDSAMVGP